MTSLLVAAFCATSSIIGAPALAAPEDPTGEWMVEKGHATIRIVDCSGQYWGVVAWEKVPGDTDKKNPDPKLRSRPTLGMPVLLGMKPSKPNEWSGDIYNSQDGRIYSASISLLRPDMLKVKGCVLGFLCGGENWTRVPPESSNAAPAAKPAAPGAGSKTAAAPAAKPSAAPNRPASARPGTPQAAPSPAAEANSAEAICSGLVGLAGGAHERRLK